MADRSDERVERFKALLRQVPTGVTVVTTWDPLAHAPYGLTVNSFVSISLSPLLVLFALQKESRTRHALERKGAYLVNFLTTRQARTAWMFADSRIAMDDRFQHTPWIEGPEGLPILTESLGWMAARIVETWEAGDHRIYLGEVFDLAQLEEEPEPLLYLRRSFHAPGRPVD